jgi:3-oxoacyl-[acyl-carrier protein] reductase
MSSYLIDHVRADASTMKQYLDATPLGRMGEPEKVARVVLAVASDDWAWVMGQIIQYSGGFQL